MRLLNCVGNKPKMHCMIALLLKIILLRFLRWPMITLMLVMKFERSDFWLNLNLKNLFGACHYCELLYNLVFYCFVASEECL
jgi:hypothetical protein